MGFGNMLLSGDRHGELHIYLGCYRNHGSTTQTLADKPSREIQCFLEDSDRLGKVKKKSLSINLMNCIDLMRQPFHSAEFPNYNGK